MEYASPIINAAITKTIILSVVAFTLAMLLTPVYTFVAYRFKFWKRQRTDSTTGEKLTVFTKLHAHKFTRNIPTMAGLIFVLVIVLITLASNLDRRETWLPLAALAGGALVGLIDDIINIRGDGKGSGGLKAKLKFLLVALLGLGLGYFFFDKLGISSVHVPYIGDVHLGALIIPLFAFVVVSMGNAVNISDGLDGLAGGLAAIAFGGFGVIALMEGNGLLAAFCFTVVEALLSYLWFNIYPARFFMGDVGSFALGTSLGVVAMLTDSLFILPVIGLVFVIEIGSSLIQILSKKIFKRKIFISAPIHHHLEASGWPETKITMRFWVIAAVMSFIGVMIALTGGII